MAVEVARFARQVVKGLPYLQKESGRLFSIQTGHVFSTPSTYHVIFKGKRNQVGAFCTIYHQVEPMLTREQMMGIIHQAKELSGKRPIPLHVKARSFLRMG